MMTPEEMQAVAITIGLVTKHPPKDEGWNRPGDPTLIRSLTSWFKEQM